MISDAWPLVRTVVAGCAVDPPHGFEWFGRKFGIVLGTGSEVEARRSFLHGLAAHLYLHVYCPGKAIPQKPPPRAFGAGEVRALQGAHSLANPDRDRWDPGWTLVGRVQDALLVRKGGLDFTVPTERCRPQGDTALRADGPVQVLVPAERWFRSPGYMLFYGRRVPRPRAAAIQRTRLYLDMDIEGARRVIDLSRRFNDTGLPFTLKVAARPDAYDRCDTVILFVERGDYRRASEILVEAAMELRARLRPGTPAFTKRLVPGASVADDPPGGESFGQSRCRLLAEGIVRAHDTGARTVESRLRKIGETFLEAGISLDHPYLESQSTEFDPGPWSHWPGLSST